MKYNEESWATSVSLNYFRNVLLLVLYGYNLYLGTI